MAEQEAHSDLWFNDPRWCVGTDSVFGVSLNRPIKELQFVDLFYIYLFINSYGQVLFPNIKPASPRSGNFKGEI